MTDSVVRFLMGPTFMCNTIFIRAIPFRGILSLSQKPLSQNLILYGGMPSLDTVIKYTSQGIESLHSLREGRSGEELMLGRPRQIFYIQSTKSMVKEKR